MAIKSKPAKPFPDFPLFPHATGRWAKKIRGRLHYFGKWDDPQAALDKYLEQRDDLYAGRVPREVNTGRLTISELANRFLTAKQRLVDSNELSASTWRNYHRACKLLIDHFGRKRLAEDVRPEDFERYRAALAKQQGPAMLRLTVTCTRVLFKYAYDSMFLDRPVRFGPMFKTPKKQVIEKARNGDRLFMATEIHTLLRACDDTPGGRQMRCWILLGLQAGFGNHDIATLPHKAVNLQTGWVEHVRPKTGIARRCPLLSQTAQALREWLAVRPKGQNAQAGQLMFLSDAGRPLVRYEGSELNLVGDRFRRLLRKTGIYRKGLSFYSLRHVAETVMGESRDQVAVDLIMGHRTPGQGTTYRHGVSDDRLRVVVEQVGKWLGEEGGES